MAEFIEDLEAGRVPKVFTWAGQPISEIPRDELERLFIEAQLEIAELNKQNCNISVQHIHDLAAMRRRYGG